MMPNGAREHLVFDHRCRFALYCSSAAAHEPPAARI
jgi:hypothetical protein